MYVSAYSLGKQHYKEGRLFPPKHLVHSEQEEWRQGWKDAKDEQAT